MEATMSDIQRWNFEKTNNGGYVLYFDHKVIVEHLEAALRVAEKGLVCRWTKSTGRRDCGFYRLVAPKVGEYCKHCGGKVEVRDE